MQSHITLDLVGAVIKTLQFNQLPEFCMPLKCALAQLISIREGQFCRQSFSNYFAHIDLFEYILEKEFTLDFNVHTSGIFILLMLQGHSVFTDPAKNFITEAQGNSCSIQHVGEGIYKRTLFKGEHKILVLTIRPEWFVRITKNFTQFKPLVENYISPVKPIYALPGCPITSAILKPLKKFQEHDGSNEKELNKAMHDFSSEVIYNYHQMLVTGRLMTDALHEIKAKEIAKFIRENYGDGIVDNVARLASMFNVSERLFSHLCKKAFQKSLHQYVIDLRMNYGLFYLVTTTKSISEVAFMVGYNDPGYFSREFKRYHKIAPTEIQALLL
ncbi:AraC-like DNA-binding protein [Pedobacter africanus]|uniref:AraC-like DNA-binding protein n=1 Tax=Pedobacter africanus TaxID=151894 RepID=A0ACC6KVZ2_9SPHI|nr:AraC family transcriptional regulator [Pedobacter africanus]MDR6783322.1 AraC-like DNA-binding protein [Pedobacter africanus]